MKIFVAGAVSSAKKEQLEKYNIYKKILEETFEDLILTTPDDIWDYRNKCIDENPNFEKISIDKLMVDYDLKQVKESDLIICDISEISTGMGIELGIAHENNKKILFFYEKGSYISNMISGSFKDAHFIEYANTDELVGKLKFELKNLYN